MNITKDMTPVEAANFLAKLEEGHLAAWRSTREAPWHSAEYQARFQNAAEVDGVFRDVMRETVENGMRRPKFRVQLSGNPILGDGKSDNQNHCIIFYRGEYIQLIDANQDNYLEECLKIRSVLAEFEEMIMTEADLIETLTLVIQITTLETTIIID